MEGTYEPEIDPNVSEMSLRPSRLVWSIADASWTIGTLNNVFMVIFATSHTTHLPVPGYTGLKLVYT